jgi:zinc transporter ZupT
MEESIIVVAVPSVLMLCGALVAFFGRVPDLIQAATQNFSAGLLIAAVAGELFPLMTGKKMPAGAADAEPPNSVLTIFAIAAGMALALGFMFGLEELMEGDEDDENENGERKTSDLEAPLAKNDACGCLTADSAIVLEAVSKQTVRMRSILADLQKSLPEGDRDTIDEHVHALKVPTHALNRVLEGIPNALDSHNRKRMQFHAEELVENLKDLESSRTAKDACVNLKAVRGTLKHIHKHAERGQFKRWATLAKPAPEQVLKEQIPWALVFTCVIDASVDGLLIGLAFAASPSAGWSMSIATTIEMCFLGLSFSAAIQNSTRSKLKHAATVALPPVMLFVTGALGSFIGKLLTSWQVVFIAFIAFAVVALLFLVTQELLTEAREIAGENKLINAMLFVGVFGGIVLETFIG